MIRKIGLVLTCAAACIGLSLFFSGCAGFSQTPAALSVCAAPDAEGSWMCAVGTGSGFSPEDLDGILLDANSIGLISGAYDRDQARRVINNLIDHIQNYPMTYNDLIALVFRDTANAGLMAQMISRHLTLFKSQLDIVPYDKQLIVTHLRRQLDLMGGK